MKKISFILVLAALISACSSGLGTYGDAAFDASSAVNAFEIVDALEGKDSLDMVVVGKVTFYLVPPFLFRWT